MKFSLFLSLFILSIAYTHSIWGDTIIEHSKKHGYRFLVDGEPFIVKGVAGDRYLKELKAFGGNTMRTWSIEAQGEEFLDEAHSLGIKVIAGIWVEHARHGYDYSDRSFVKKQRRQVEAVVKKYKDHPAILAWGLGNEVELRLSDEDAEAMWEEMNELALIVKKADPDHPIMSSVAGFNQEKIDMLQNYFPELDIIGANAYGFAPRVGILLKEYGWEKPYMITEFGPIGHWEEGVRKSEWGAPIEETSHEKAKRYRDAQVAAMDEDSKYCLGTFPFYWSSKQEITTTWFGMFLPGGEHLEAVDIMSYSWNKKYPKNRVPEIVSLDSKAKLNTVKRRSIQTASVEVLDHEKDELTYHWVLMDESQEKTVGGDFEKTPTSYPKLILSTSGSRVDFKAPRKKGAYRLFVYVKDTNNGAATANFPFYVD